MATPKERLTHLLELAAQGDAARPMLAHELADVLLDWPAEYPPSARQPFEALLEKTARDLDRETRAALARRFARRSDAPIGLLNELFFAASAEMKDDIVKRNADMGAAAADAVRSVDEAALLGAARSRAKGFESTLAQALDIHERTAKEILRDSSGRSLAVALRGAHAGRATYSAIAVLCDRMRAAEDSYLKLSFYEIVPEEAAEHMLAYWRSHEATDLPPVDRAAE